MKGSDTQPVAGIACRIKEIFRNEPDLTLAILYGSAANGKIRRDSDVDIALLFTHPLSTEKKMELISRLEAGLHREVDLADLYALSGTILKQILSKGHVLIQSRSGVLAGLVRRMVYNQADMMPYVSRTLQERQKRFVHG